MPRYDVTVTLTQTFNLAIEADDPLEAQSLAIGVMNDEPRPPERVETEFHVERGVT